MPKLADIFVTVIYVVDDGLAGVDKKIELISSELKSRYTNYEILLIDNGLLSTELKKAKNLLDSIACVRIIRLSKVHDVDTAIFAGVEASIGDVVCILYDYDPPQIIHKFVSKIEANHDIVFGVAKNLKRRTHFEQMGAKVFYWYSRRYQKIDIPAGATYFICMNRTVANALTRSGRFMRHIRHMSKLVGFNTANVSYNLPAKNRVYSHTKPSTLWSRAIDLISNYSNHPMRVLTYFGIFAGSLNIVYAVYVVIVNLTDNDVAKGWTSLSLQSSVMFFILFIILAVLAEYVGKILNETQQEPPYHIMQELSSTISIADETRRNVTK